MELLARETLQGGRLHNVAFDVPWTGFIDAVEIAYDPSTKDASGLRGPEETAPLLTQRHFNVFQEATEFSPFPGVEVEPEGTRIEDNAEYNPSGAWLDYNQKIDANDSHRLYHWIKKGQPGIEVDAEVQNLMWSSFFSAIYP